MRAASSVSSLEEGEGIINDDEYERAVCRIEKINKKITTLVRNWNEESKSAKTPTELIEIDEFHRPYMDQEAPSITPGGMATPIAQDLIWPGHPDIQRTSLFPRDDDPSTVEAGGLDPEERWKIHHPYDIPGVRRPTMDTPDNLRRLAESEALVESLQTMEYLTEFHALEERRDFR